MGGINAKMVRNRMPLPGDMVIAAVEAAFDMPQEVLVSPTKEKEIHRMRNVAMLLLRKLAHWTYRQLGDYFGLHFTFCRDAIVYICKQLNDNNSENYAPLRLKYKEAYQLALSLVIQRAVERAPRRYTPPTTPVLVFAKRDRHIVVNRHTMCAPKSKRTPKGIDFDNLPYHQFYPDNDVRCNDGILRPEPLLAQGVAPQRMCKECARAFDIVISGYERNKNKVYE